MNAQAISPAGAFFGFGVSMPSAPGTLDGQASANPGLGGFQALLAQFANPEQGSPLAVLSPEEMQAFADMAVEQENPSFAPANSTPNTPLWNLSELQDRLQELGAQLESLPENPNPQDLQDTQELLEGLQALVAQLLQPAMTPPPTAPEGEVDLQSQVAKEPSAEAPTFKQAPLMEEQIPEQASSSLDLPVFQAPRDVPSKADLSLISDAENTSAIPALPASLADTVLQVQAVVQQVGQKLAQLMGQDLQKSSPLKPLETPQAESSEPELIDLGKAEQVAQPQETLDIATAQDLPSMPELVHQVHEVSRELKQNVREELPKLVTSSDAPVQATNQVNPTENTSQHSSHHEQSPHSRHEFSMAPEALPKGSEPVAKVESPQPTPQVRMQERMDQYQSVRQVSQKIQWMVQNGEGKAVLRLDPPELGHIEIEVETKGGEMKVHMKVENEAVKDTLESSVPQLRQSMEQHQVKLEKLEVQVEQRLDAQSGQSQADAQRARRQEQQGKGNRRGMKVAEVSVDIPQLSPGRRYGYNTMELTA